MSQYGGLDARAILCLKKLREELGDEKRKRLSGKTLAVIFNLKASNTERVILQLKSAGAIEVESNLAQRRIPRLIIWLEEGNKIIEQSEERQDIYLPKLSTEDRRYVEREVDLRCIKELQGVGRSTSSLPFVRIKGAMGMGKSSLLRHLRDGLKNDYSQVVGFIDLFGDSFQADDFTDLNKLLQRFTQVIANSFKKSSNRINPPSIKDYWQEDLASGLNCTNYLHEHIFSKISKPKILVIDGLDKVLEQEHIRTDFCNVLRSWCVEEMRLVRQEPIIWTSIIIAYSTEKYGEKGIVCSPFYNVGIEIELQEFSLQEIQKLSTMYDVNLNKDELDSLKYLIGGHPTLTNQALSFLKQNGKNLLDLESKSILVNGPFGEYLRHILQLLQVNDKLYQSFYKILKGENCDNELIKFQLEKAGLIKIDNKGVSVRFELYQKYFKQHLGVDNEQ